MCFHLNSAGINELKHQILLKKILLWVHISGLHHAYKIDNESYFSLFVTKFTQCIFTKLN